MTAPRFPWLWGTLSVAAHLGLLAVLPGPGLPEPSEPEPMEMGLVVRGAPAELPVGPSGNSPEPAAESARRPSPPAPRAARPVSAPAPPPTAPAPPAPSRTPKGPPPPPVAPAQAAPDPPVPQEAPAPVDPPARAPEALSIEPGPELPGPVAPPGPRPEPDGPYAGEGEGRLGSASAREAVEGEPREPSEAYGSPLPRIEAAPAYAETPPPLYPRMARRRGLEGEVWLRVRVSAAGSVLAVEVERSSSHAILDGAAVDAVRRWRFHPARAGEFPVEGVVRVPIRFELLPSS